MHWNNDEMRKDVEIIEDHHHPFYTVSQPNARKRLGAIRLETAADGENVVVGSTTYIFKDTLGTPGAGEVHVKTQANVLAAVKKLVRALQGLTDADIVYETQAANAEAQALWTTIDLSLGATTLAKAGGTGAGTVYLREILADQTGAITLDGTVTHTKIAFEQFFSFSYSTVANQITGDYLCVFPIGHFPTRNFDVNVFSLLDVAVGITNDIIEFDFFYSNDEVTFTQISEGEKGVLTSSKDSKLIPIHQKRIPPGYGCYCKMRTQDGAVANGIEFAVTGHLYPVEV